CARSEVGPQSPLLHVW
nr:immunoglobulin heavy chain junction region [Macaca mulatta]